MPRTERDLDPSGGPLAAFAVELRTLRVEAGSPKYLQMARGTGRSRTALAEAAGGDHLPTWETVEAYIRACGCDPAPWLIRWEQVRDEVRGVRPPASTQVVAATVTEPPVIDMPDKRLPRRTLVLGAATVVTTLGVVMGLRLTSTDASSTTTMRSTGARGPVMLSFSQFDPRHLAVARGTGQITVLDADDGDPVCTIDSQQAGTTVVAFDWLDRFILATGGPGGVVRLWSYPESRALLSLSAPDGGAITHLVSDPTNRHHLAAAHGRTVTIWDTDSGQRLQSFGAGAPISSLGYDPATMNTLAVALQDGRVAIWDSSNGRLVRPLQGRFHQTVALAFDPLTRNTLATGEADGSVRIWDSSTGKPVRPIRNTLPVGALAFNPRVRNSLATGNADGTVRIWDSSTGLPAETLQTGRASVTAVAYAVDGKRLAAGTDDGTVTTWPVQY